MMGNDNSKRRSSATKDEAKARKASMGEEALRIKGNECFRAQNYLKAIEFYTEIIRKNPSNHIAFTNRANTYMRLKQFEDASADCISALKYVPESIKANYYLGQCLCECGFYDTGISHLETALNIGQRQNGMYEKEISDKLKKWQQQRYIVNQNKQQVAEIELRCYLTDLIVEDKERQVQEIKDKYTKNGNGPINRKDKDSKVNLTKADEDRIATIETFSEKVLHDTRDIFQKAEDTKRKREIPDYLCCPVSFDLIRDPVITNSGITYERKVLLEHLKQNGNFDPTTRQYLKKEDLIPNLVMKEVITDFISKNDWALQEI